MRKNDLEKGTYGYIDKYRKRRIITLVLWCVLIGTIIAVPWLHYGTRNNYFTILAVVLVLPFARIFSTFLIMLPYHTGDKTEYEKIQALTNDKMILLSDLVLTKESGSMLYTMVVIFDGKVYAYAPQQKMSELERSTYLKTLMWEKGFTRKPLVYDNFEDFYETVEMLSVNVPEEAVSGEEFAAYLKTFAV